MNKVTTEYHGVAIEYDEDADRWQFTLDGRERSAGTLANAKKAIDAPVPKDRPKWKPFKAYFSESYSGYEFVEVTVTSVAETDSYRRAEFWIKNAKQKREKVSADRLFAHSEENATVIACINQLSKEEDEIKSRMRAARQKLIRVSVPNDGKEEANG